MTVITIRDSNHLSSELASAGGKLVVIDFTATWCGPCKQIAPEYEKLSQKYQNAKFTKVDVDDCSDVAQNYDVRAMPTFLFMKHSKEIDRFSGADIAKLESVITKNCTVESFTGSGYSLSGSNSTSSSDVAAGAARAPGFASWLGSAVGLGGSDNGTTAPVSQDMNRDFENQAKEVFPVDEKAPVCQVQLRLADGSRLQVRMNTTETVGHLRDYIAIARPMYGDVQYQLLTTHPNKVIDDESLTLEEANLANCVVVTKLIK